MLHQGSDGTYVNNNSKKGNFSGDNDGNSGCNSGQGNKEYPMFIALKVISEVMLYGVCFFACMYM